MKTISILRSVQQVMAVVAMGLVVVACQSASDGSFGAACETGDECISKFCVGGEAGTEIAPFCSDDCTGKKTGDACGDGQGKCIADFVAWCWLPCDTDAECTAVNPERPRCSSISSSAMESPFKVCIGKAKK